MHPAVRSSRPGAFSSRDKARVPKDLESGKTGVRDAAQTAHRQVVDANPDPQYQAAIRSFDIAMRHFQRRNLEKANEVFSKLAQSRFAEVADRARLHLRLCQQRMQRRQPVPKTASGLYLLGLTELNSRNLEPAVEHLAKAARLEPRHEHIHYALAAAYALQGRASLAFEYLRLAIELRPENAFQARNDHDFKNLASDLRFQLLVRSTAARGPRADS